MKAVLVDIKGIKKYFTVQSALLSGRQSVVKAVDGLFLKIYRGEILLTLSIEGHSNIP
jgi:ABC-type oligopeptide transport system ATPase subunit